MTALGPERGRSSRPRPAGRNSAASTYTRVLAVAILPFLMVATVLLYLLPRDTDSLFAWTIDPPMTAMFLASAYLGGIWFFSAAARPGNWRAVRRGMPAVFVFASLLLVATLLHLDRFHAGHISFVTWLVLYLTTPALVLLAMVLNRGADDGSDAPLEYHLGLPVRIVLALVGLVALVVGVTLFVNPQLFLSSWPWTLTPLTARVVGAALTLPGVVNLALLVDPRWSAFRTVFQAQLFSLVFIIGALILSRGDFDQGSPGAIAFQSGIAVSVVAYAALYAYCERRRQPPIRVVQNTERA
ncbi:hypothetical protein V6S67_10255 [Arthrobacter sp. Soc17.1.1.1]|uniref:hypothetical protein n=1 Tax=Arthrobacter sp. Soc17.1.1.1 TaxID=3121277 RepID=UPI002FE43D9F